MKRDPALVPLSHDHHEALVLARRACEPERPHAEPAPLRAQVLARWTEHFEPHFALEESVLFPALHAAGRGDAAAEGHAQHARLRQLAARLRDEGPAALPDWGAALRDHVHWEERILFPLAQEVLDLAALRPLLQHRESTPCPQ